MAPPRRTTEGAQPPAERLPKTTSAAKPQLPLFSIVTDGAPLTWQAATASLADLPGHLAAQIAIDPVSGCWVWTGSTDKDGYGRYSGEGVHRLVYRLLVGEIPADRPQLDHVAALGCVYRACCWPAHLEPVTSRTNTMRGNSFAAVNAAKAACDHGHPFDAANTYIRPDGHRDCRACVRRRVAEYAGRQRALARAA